MSRQQQELRQLLLRRLLQVLLGLMTMLLVTVHLHLQRQQQRLLQSSQQQNLPCLAMLQQQHCHHQMKWMQRS
jgi:sensor domain CHASE-containing protein